MRTGADRYAEMFVRLKGEERGAYIPFVMLCDPDEGASLAILETLAANGADALELGIPFSDPVADGPVIQEAANRALAAGATPERCFGVVRKFRAMHPDVPVGLLVYANLVVSRGVRAFYQLAAQSGVDSVLVADAPLAAYESFAPQAEMNGIAPVYIAPPNADERALREIAARSKGYVYFLGRSGVTGAEQEMQLPQADNIRILKEAGSAPVVVGFGISRPQHVRKAISSGADGAISGSATVGIVARNLDDAERMKESLAAFTLEMAAATRSLG